MRIDGKFQYGIDKLESNATKKRDEAKKGEAGKGAESSDKVSISSRGRDAAILAQTLKEAPEVRADRVEDIRKQIADGSYNVSGRQVAEKIVNAALDDLF